MTTNFVETRQAVKTFQNGIICSDCEEPKNELQFLGTSCKHAFCWDCIEKMTVEGKKRRGGKTLCRRCVMELNLNKISGATILNNCSNLLKELEEHLEKFEQGKSSMSREDIACTQKILENFDLKEKTRTIDEFLMTQPIDEPSSNEEEPRTSSVSPELDAFTEYSNPKLIRSVEKQRRGSVKRSSEEVQTKIELPAKKRAQPINFDLFNSQIPEKPSDMLTPFVNRRKTESAVNSGPISLFSDPLKSQKKDDIFTKKVAQPRRAVSSGSSIIKSEFGSESKNTRRSSVMKEEVASFSGAESIRDAENGNSELRMSGSRSTSPSSISVVSTRTRSKRRDSIGTRRGEAVMINSILENRIPQLKSTIEVGTCVNERVKDKTPLYIAVQENNLEAVKLLVEAGAIINASCETTHETTLHEAVRQKNAEIADYLLSKGASMKVKNSWQKSPEDLVAREDLKMRKIFDRYRNKHILQPVIPPRRPKIYFVSLTDDKILSDAQKAKLPGKINLVSRDMVGISHHVVKIDEKTEELRIGKENLAQVLDAIIKPGMIVSSEWLRKCIADERKIQDDEKFKVKKLRWMDCDVIEGSIQQWKKTDDKMTPKLFSGCNFYFSQRLYTFMERKELAKIVRDGGGTVLLRLPVDDNDNQPPPYYNSKLKPTFVVYSLKYQAEERYRNPSKYTLVCDQWLIESILSFSLTISPY